MNINEIMNNWKNYTGYNTVQEYLDNEESDPYTDEETEATICDFCNEYNYNHEVYRYLYESYD